MKSYINHLINSTNKISKFLFIFTVFIFVINSFQLNNYEILFIDERLLIDDIYNVWLIDDVYANFDNIKNNILKSFLVILYEIVYGGDLRYGRLWSNFYIIFSGPVTLFGDVAVITFTRLLNIFLYTLSIFILTKTFIKNKFSWLALAAFFSIPGIEMLMRIPKPEVLSIFLFSIGLYYLQSKKNYKALLFLGLCTFVKLNFVFIYFFVSIFLLKNASNKISEGFKILSISFCSLFIVNPILIIPPIRFLNYEIPNFYKTYLEWIVSQGSYGQTEFFSINYFFKWSILISNFYKLPVRYSIVISIMILLLLSYLLKISFKNNKRIAIILLITTFVYFLFYFLFIERQFSWYLTFPFLLLYLSLFINFENVFNGKRLYFMFIPFYLFICLGIYSNLQSNMNARLFAPPQSLGYVDIENKEDAIKLVEDTISVIEKDLEKKDNDKIYIVLWDPNLYLPRNGVTYRGNFFVRENWVNEEIDELLNTAEYVVTYENLNVPGLKKVKVKNYYLYSSN